MAEVASNPERPAAPARHHAPERRKQSFWHESGPWIGLLIQLLALIFAAGILWEEVRANSIRLDRLEQMFYEYAIRPTK